MNWRRFFERDRRDGDIAEELAAYLEHEIADNMARGMNREDARSAAACKLGNRTLIQEEIHKMNSLGFIEGVWSDLRLAARSLHANPSFTVVAVLSLGLGIGANAALFQLIDAVMLRSLPVKDPGKLVEYKLAPPANRSGHFWDQPNEITEPQWNFLRAHHDPFQEVFAWGRTKFNLSKSGPARFANGIYVSGDFFQMLGVNTSIGRVISAADDRPGCGANAAVVSYGFWQRELGGDPSVLSRTLIVSGRTVPVIGVTPSAFTGIDAGEPFDVAVPLCSEQTFDDDGRVDRNAFWWLGVFGRLKAGTSLKDTSAYLQSISPELYRSTVSPHFGPEEVKEYVNLRLLAAPGATGFSNLRRSVQAPLFVLFSLAGFVLILASANLANLLLARTNVREHEIAIRLAVGASRWRIIQQLLAESFLLAAGGAALGTLLALVLSRYLVRLFSQSDQTYWLDLSFDLRFACFVVALTIITCLLFGFVPAFRASRREPGTSLKQAGRNTTATREHFSLQRLLVVAQVSLSLLLLVGALLFTRSFQKLMTLDPGFRINGLISVGIDYGPSIPRDRWVQTWTDVVSRVRNTPGIVAAAAVAQPPITGGWSNKTIHIDGDKVADRVPGFNWPGDGYFQAMSIPLLAGRDFTAHDDNSSAPVAIVDTTFAERFLGGANPVSRTFYVRPNPGEPIKRRTIIGLVGRSKYQDLQSPFGPMVYEPIRQRQIPFPGAWLVVRSAMPLAESRKSITDATLSANSNLAMVIRSFPAAIHDSTRNEDIMAQLSSFFGLLAIVLSTLGLYGVMSYIVTHRKNEIGIRLAVGAHPRDILSMILKQSLWMLLVGIAAGAGLSLVLSKSAQSLLFEVQANDPWIVGAAALLLTAIAIAATLIPARRAARLDPMATLRNE